MKIELGAIVTNVRGSIGDQTASKNRFGNFMRARVIPFEGGSTYKSIMRGYFSTISGSWKLLTQDQRDQWNKNSLLFSFQDCFANLRHLSGFNLFVSCNMFRFITARSLIVLPPVPTRINPVSIISCVADFSTQTVTVTLSGNILASQTLMFYCSLGTSAGVSRYHGTYYYVYALDSYVGLTRSITAQFLARFSAVPAAGQKLFFKSVVFNRFSGLSSLPQYCSTIIIS